MRFAFPPRLVQSRHVSSSITINAVDRRISLPPARLRVPLMKSPSYFGHATQRVNRPYNEDRYSAAVIDVDNHKLFNFNIYDGHGGSQCSSYLANNLSKSIEQFDYDQCDEIVSQYGVKVGGYWRRWARSKDDHYAAMNKNTLSLTNVPVEPKLKLTVPLSFLKTDFDFMNSEDNRSGSTCTSTFINTLCSEEVDEDYYFNRGTVNLLTVAHVGDTKAILVDNSGLAHALTIPHHPSNPLEAARLRKYATNFMTDSFGEERFISLANTRAFGDINFKQQGVSAEPDVSQYIIGDKATISKKLSEEEIGKYTVAGTGGDESFLILCSDGVTGILTDQEIADIIMTNYNNKGIAGTPQLGAEEVLKFVEYVGGDDNATVLVVRLNGWGKWPILDRTGELRQSRLDDYNPRDRRG